MFSLCITWRGRYHWVYIGFFYPSPCCDQAHGPCLRVLHLVSLRWGKARYAMNLSLTNHPLVDSNMGNFDPCPREVEGAEGSDRCRVWLSLFAQCSASGWLLGFVSWRAKDGLVRVRVRVRARRRLQTLLSVKITPALHGLNGAPPRANPRRAHLVGTTSVSDLRPTPSHYPPPYTISSGGSAAIGVFPRNTHVGLVWQNMSYDVNTFWRLRRWSMFPTNSTWDRIIYVTTQFACTGYGIMILLSFVFWPACLFDYLDLLHSFVTNVR